MLRNVKPHRDRRWVTVADLEVQIADSAIESKLVRIDDRLARRRSPRCKLQHVPACSKKFVSLLVAGRFWCQEKQRAMRPISNEPNSGPEVDRLRDAIPSLRHKDYALSRCLLNAINRGLNGSGTRSTL